jgi:predicted MPP superfamily phosphohydrolase
MTRGTFIKTSVLGLAASSLLLTAFGENPLDGQLRNQFYRVRGSPGLQGQRLVVLADIHYGWFFGEPETRILSARVSALKPDLVFFAGDLAHEPTTDLSGFLASWSAPGEHYFSSGNHDIPLLPGDPGTVLAQLRTSSIRVLENEKIAFGDYNIIGMSSGLCGTPDFTLLDTKYNLVISHEPDLWDHYHGPVLHLAGHTHGGQIQILGQPLLLPSLGHKYPQGLFTKSARNNLIVSRGIGTSGVNVRIGCPPEIVVVDFI